MNFCLSIPPTSVKLERAFPSSEFLSSRMRSCLSNDTLDEPVFLRFLLKKGSFFVIFVESPCFFLFALLYDNLILF